MRKRVGKERAEALLCADGARRRGNIVLLKRFNALAEIERIQDRPVDAGPAIAALVCWGADVVHQGAVEAVEALLFWRATGW